MCRGPPRVEALPVTLDREEEEEEYAKSSLSHELSTVYTDTVISMSNPGWAISICNQHEQSASAISMSNQHEQSA